MSSRSSGPPSAFRYEVAISFAGEDRAIASEIAERLRSAEISVFFDEFKQSELWGENLYEYLAAVYSKDARFCLMLVSEHYLRKAWTQHERRSAQERAFRETGREYILPLRLDDAEVPGLPETTGYLDFRKHSIDEVVGWLIEKIEAHRGTPRSPLRGLDPRGVTSPDATSRGPAPSTKPSSKVAGILVGFLLAVLILAGTALMDPGGWLRSTSAEPDRPVDPRQADDPRDSPTRAPAADAPENPPPTLEGGAGETGDLQESRNPLDSEVASAIVQKSELVLVLDSQSASSSVRIDGRPAEIVDQGLTTLTLLAAAGRHDFTLTRSDGLTCTFTRVVTADTRSFNPNCLWGTDP